MRPSGRYSLRSRAAPEAFVLGELSIDYDRRRATVGDRAVVLTATEFELLRCLASAPGNVVSREHLSREALGRGLLPYDRSIDTHISNVRRKLERAGVTTPTIQNQRGVGYRLLVEE